MTTDSTPDPQQPAPSDVEDRVLKVIATTKRLPRESVTLDSTFEALGIDSLDRLNILFDLESEFDIQINDEDAKRVENIRQMVAGVVLLLLAKEGGTPSTVMTPGLSEAGEPRADDSPAGDGNGAATTKLPSSLE